jgi:calcium-dependent protein kinase
MTEKVAAEIFSQILSAVCFCHDKDIAHRDLKPDNVIFVETPGMK